MLHHDLGAERHTRIKIDHIVVDQPKAAGRHRLPNGLWGVGAVDAVDGPAKIHRARTERIARAAGHPARQIRLAYDHLRRRHPVRPFTLERDLLYAAPLKTVAADADAVTHRNAIAHDEVEITVVGIHDDGAGRLFGPVIH